ncbi:type II secretion system F family protein [Aliikangiella marina]|uniref:Type II secretion system F family protein n=1 Tax=Aliikangiella marina TaxID=1712262 RepID=A0A545T4D7_9GAMM|nr:type II secretion system F family protein [Aliikangiella marina]TQV71989.1 type II secretion system F family protein [Aliikangiella marina]TQV72042.1 type II secretion system F family protein [Aliikangiella marina]
MATFEYVAKNASGESISGTMEAVNREVVADRLLSRGNVPVNIAEKSESESLLDADIGKIFRSRSVKLQDLVMFSRQMYSLTKAGIPLTRAIAGLLETTNSIALREALESINSDLNAGNNLASSFARHDHIFSSIYVSLIHVGENSGRLEEAFRQIAEYLELEQTTRQRIKSAMRYPMFVTLAIVAAVIIINIWVIPQFSSIFAQFNAGQLPLPTRILMATSEFFLNYWWLVGLLSVGSVVGFLQYIKTPAGKLWWDRIKLKFPVIGDIIYRALLARFSRTFGMMIRSGVPLINALNIVAEVVDNDWVAQHVRDMRGGVENGESIRLVASRTEMFSPLVIQMVSVGEETGQLDEMLEQVALFYEEQVDYDLKKLSDYIEPIMIVFIGGIVLILMLAVYLPMWELTSAGRRG